MFKLIAVAALVLCELAPAQTTPTIDRVIKELESVRTFSGVSISPDGHWITWVEAAADHSGDSEIYLFDRTNPATQPVRIASGNPDIGHREHSIVWSPDSKQFTFLRDQNQ